MRKSLVISIIMFLIIGMWAGTVNAASAGISSSISKVQLGEEVKITVSFDSKVSAVQFKLNFDSAKFEYVSNSADEDAYSPDTKKFAHAKSKPSITNVQFVFRAKKEGKIEFKLTEMKLKVDPKQEEPTVPSISKNTVAVTAEKKKEDTHNTVTNNTVTNNTNTNNINTNKPNTNNDKKNNTVTNNTVKNETNINNTTEEPKNEIDENAIVNEIQGEENTITSDQTQEESKSIWDYIIYVVIGILAVVIIVAVIIVIKKRREDIK